MSDETKWTPGPWQTFNMVGESGETVTPDEIGEYVKNAVLKGDLSRFLFVAQPGEGYDICHVGNGPAGPYNTHLIAAAPELYKIAEGMQAWITDGGHEDDPDVAYICGEARRVMAKARGETS